MHCIFTCCTPPPFSHIFVCMPMVYTPHAYWKCIIYWTLVKYDFSTGFQYTLDIHIVYERFSLDYYFNGTGIRLYFTGIQSRTHGYTFPLLVYSVIITVTCHPTGIHPYFSGIHCVSWYKSTGCLYSYTRYNRAIRSVNIIFLYCPRPTQMPAGPGEPLYRGLVSSLIKKLLKLLTMSPR